jgi:putative ABC transport system permease protein
MNDFRIALRSLLSTPVPAAVVILTLALAIAASAAIFSVVSGVLMRPLGYGDDSRIVVLWTSYDGNPGQSFRLSPADYRDLREEVDGLGGQVGLYRSIGSTLTGLDRPVSVGSLTVTPRLFSALQAQPSVGRLFDDADERPGGDPIVLLTYDSWSRRFGGDPDLIGQTIEVDGSPRTVVGVTAPGFRFPPGDDEIEIYFPMTLSDAVLLDRNHRMFDGIARLGDGVSLSAVNAELDALGTRLQQEFPLSNEGWGFEAIPLRNELIGNLDATLWILTGAVLLVLVTACANVANVLVARSTVTSHEFALRAALGARTRDLARRSLAESLLLGLAGGGFGLGLATWGVAFLRGTLPASIPRADEIALDPAVLAFALALSVAATLVFGALPALRAVTPNLAELLKPTGGNAVAGGARRAREAMVVLQVAVAIVLMVAAATMARSFLAVSSVDPGFRETGVVSMAVGVPTTRHDRSEFAAFFDSIVDRVGGLPGVRAAGATSDLPMSAVALDLDLEFQLVGGDALDVTARPNADFRLVLPGYFEAMGMEMVSGRALREADRIATRSVAVVNETLVARYLPNLDPLGRLIRTPMLGDVEIVGVVADTRHGGLQSRYESQVFVPYGRIATGKMHVVAWSDRDPDEVKVDMVAALQDLDPELAPTELVALEDLLWDSVAMPRFNTALLVGLALAAGLLAIIGTYGIVAYSVARRTSEIGVRVALGASGGATVWLIVRQALGTIAVGAVVGLGAALASTRLLAGLLPEGGTFDAGTYAVVALTAVLVGVLASWLPARRATRIDPVNALRES